MRHLQEQIYQYLDLKDQEKALKKKLGQLSNQLKLNLKEPFDDGSVIAEVTMRRYTSVPPLKLREAFPAIAEFVVEETVNKTKLQELVKAGAIEEDQIPVQVDNVVPVLSVKRKKKK